MCVCVFFISLLSLSSNGPFRFFQRWLCAQKERIMHVLAVFRRKKTVSARIGERERERQLRKKRDAQIPAAAAEVNEVPSLRYLRARDEYDIKLD